jgi:hypothetical protein
MKPLLRMPLPRLHRLLALGGASVASVASCSSSPPASTAPPNEAGSDVTTADNDGGTGSLRDAAGTAPDGGAVSDDGPSRCNGATLPDGGTCPARTPGTLTIVGSTYSAKGSAIAYGTAPDLWNVYGFAGPGQVAPSVTPTGGALAVSANLVRPTTGQGWAGVGVSIDGPKCIDETNYARGIQFTLAGDLGGCLLYLDAITSLDESVASDPCRGACLGGADACVAPSVQISQFGMMTIPNASFDGGRPIRPADTKVLIGFRWRLQTPDTDAGTGCTANITISNVQFFGL